MSLEIIYGIYIVYLVLFFQRPYKVGHFPLFTDEENEARKITQLGLGHLGDKL